jgi:hypothetical protein
MGDTERSRTSSSGLAFAAAFVVLVVGLFIALGGTAYAQISPAGDEYDDDEAANVFTPPAGDVSGADTGGLGAETLPFSGLSLLGTALIGVALVATGILLRRREKSEKT